MRSSSRNGSRSRSRPVRQGQGKGYGQLTSPESMASSHANTNANANANKANSRRNTSNSRQDQMTSNDDIPRFASFDDFNQIGSSGNVMTSIKNNQGSGNGNGSAATSRSKSNTSRTRKHHTDQHYSASSASGGRFTSNSSNSSTSQSTRNIRGNDTRTTNGSAGRARNAIDLAMAKLGDVSSVFSGLDAQDVASYKWAKEQAAAIVENESRSIMSASGNSTTASTSNGTGTRSQSAHKNHGIRPPTNAGFLRSASASSRSSFQHGKSNSQNASAGVTPVKRNTEHHRHSSSSSQNVPRLPPNGQNGHGHGHGLKTRTRSTSPSSQRKDKSKSSISAFRRKQKQPSKKSMKNSKKSTEEIRLRKHYAKKTFTFQSPEPLYTCRTIDLKARAAFERKRYITSEELYDLAKAQVKSEGGTMSKSVSASSSAVMHKLKKMSPSPQYLEVLKAMDDVKSTRQICWSPAVSPEADPFFDLGEDDLDDVDDQNGNNANDGKKDQSNSAKMGSSRMKRRKMLLAKKRRESAAKRVGKYRRIDPVEYIQKTLPDHQPLLTNVKRRLPMRSDVGFPRATEEEFMLKQQEIAHEAQLEEISPRLIVLLNSDDLGSSPDLAIDGMMERSGVKGEYSLPGMPFATNVLFTAKQTPSVVRSHQDASTKSLPRKIPKPDMYSIFAPPLDSTSSSSEIWRSRPFSDRPAGLVNSLAVPVNVSFGVGNIEPLVCTLSLYCLPKRDTNTAYRGKISEDFVFPAGDWGDMLDENAGKILAEQFGMSGISDRRRVKKALFSYDPLALPVSGGDDGKGSLYLFMQVQKVAHLDADEAYLDQGKGSNTSQFMSFAKRGSFTKRDPAGAAQRANQAFNTFGTQFLTPFCFGVLPLFPEQAGDEQIHWPHGASQTMQLFSYLHMNEGEEEFMQRLLALGEFVNENPAGHPDLEMSMTPGDSESFDSQSTLDSHDAGKKSRRFRGLKGKRSKLPPAPSDRPIDMAKLNGLKLIDGTATFYTSMLGSDFSQSLLQSPGFLNTNSLKDFPRLLVDSSGDCAIMLNPDQKELSVRKRSDLIRLPPSKDSSGYADSSEVREILYLPPKIPNSNTLQVPGLGPQHNFLYLYPLSIAKDKDGTMKKGHCHSVRVRLVRQVTEADKVNKSYTADHAIYNPSFVGAPLLQAVYTKIPLCVTQRKAISSNDHLCMKDEIKVRLPEVLDGSHFIQFSLYTVEVNAGLGDESGGLKQSLVAETLIPLSSSTTKEAASSTKVSTVIPDGVHRIKLSPFQLQVQSRLVSKVHISDPSVAAVFKELTTDVTLNRDKNKMVAYSNILSKASNDSILCHFHTLLFLHLRCLVNQGEHNFDFRAGEAVENKITKGRVENLKSLMELVLKLKKSLAKKSESALHMKTFFKCAFDNFDDKHFQQRSGESEGAVDGAENSDDSIESKDLNESLQVSFEDADEVTIESYEQKAGAYQFNLHPLSSRITSGDKDTRLRQAYKALNSSAPLNRKAYGASKTDRMRAEAELYESSYMLTELVDDDETVVTAATWHSQARLISASMSVTTPAPSHHDGGKSVNNETVHTKDLTSIFGCVEETAGKDAGADIETPFERAKEIAKRMNTVARVFVTPCVAPSIGSTKVPVREKLSDSKKIRELHSSDPRIQSLREKLPQSPVSNTHLAISLHICKSVTNSSPSSTGSFKVPYL